MLPENPLFLIRGDDGVEYGPVDLAELRDWVQEHRAGLGTEVRRDEPGARWAPWQNYPELVALLAEVSVTSGMPEQPSLAIAPMWRRILAFGLDLVLAYILVIPILVVLMFAYFPGWLIQCGVAASSVPYVAPEVPGSLEMTVTLIVDVTFALYFSVFQTLHGQTPAKQLFRLRVVNESGEKPDFVRSFWRAILVILSIYLFFLPMVYAFFNPQRRAFHDMATRTCVVEA